MTTAELLRKNFSEDECAIAESTDAAAAHPACIASPANEETVSELVRLASAERLKILPAGSQCHLHARNLCDRADLLLSTLRLDSISHFEPADLTATAGAGATLGKLAALTMPRRQFLPLDPPCFEKTTLGGVVSANLFGQLRTGYGTIRDYVVGARFVRGDGTAVKSGGRVVKNVTGFDLHKLLIGARGTLGIVTEISMKLRPMPESELTVLSCVGERGLPMLLSELSCATLLPIRVAALNREAARIVLPEFTGGDYAVMVCFGDSAAGNRHQAEKLRLICAASRADADTLADPLAEAAWLRLRELDPAIEPDLTLRISVLPSRTCDVIGRLTQTLRTVAARPVIVAMPQVGVVWASVRETDAGEWPALIAELRSMVRGGPGSVIVERAPVKLKREVDVFGEAGEAPALTERIRLAFDPCGVFLAERFLK